MGHMWLEQLTKGCGSASLFALGSSNRDGFSSCLPFSAGKKIGNSYFDEEEAKKVVVDNKPLES